MDKLAEILGAGILFFNNDSSRILAILALLNLTRLSFVEWNPTMLTLPYQIMLLSMMAICNDLSCSSG